MDDQNNTDGCLYVVNKNFVTTKIASLYTDKLMSDVTLAVNGIDFPAHRLILCVSSDVFEVMLMSPNWNESRENRITLIESAGCTQVFQDFLKFLYTGEVNLTTTSVIHVLELSDKYNVRDLVFICAEYIESRIAFAASKSELIRWYQYTTNCGHHTISNMCQNFIKWNFAAVAQADDFALLEPEQLYSILTSDDIVVTDENTLLYYVLYWIECQKPRFPGTIEGEAEFQELVERTLLYIRFPMITPRQVAEMVLIPQAQKYNKFIMDLMTICMKFHSNNVDQLNDEPIQSHPFRSKIFTPRLYCADQWSISITIDPFTQFNHYQSKTLVFSTPVSLCEPLFQTQTEWVVDFYPKGIFFDKCLLIGWDTVECPAHIIRTVRLAVHCKHEDDAPMRVQISVLMSGMQDGVEHIRSVYKRRVIFSRSDKIVNIDNILPYEELVSTVTRNTQQPHHHTHGFPYTPKSAGKQPEAQRNVFSQNNTFDRPRSCFLVGKSQDTVKVRIIITPLHENN